MGLEPRDVASGEKYFSAARSPEAGDRLDQGCFARPVGANQADNLTLGNFEGDSRERVRLAVAEMEIPDFEQSAHSSTSSPR